MRILRAIRRRDGAAAEAEVRRHLQEIETIVMKEL
jgi:DNA-binding FadR family transcriptional regulator